MMRGLLIAASRRCPWSGHKTKNDFKRPNISFTSPPRTHPFFILGYPMFDTAFASCAEDGRRANLAEADRITCHHRLMRMGNGRPLRLILDRTALPRSGALPEHGQERHILVRALRWGGAGRGPLHLVRRAERPGPHTTGEGRNEPDRVGSRPAHGSGVTPAPGNRARPATTVDRGRLQVAGPTAGRPPRPTRAQSNGQGRAGRCFAPPARGRPARRSPRQLGLVAA